MNISHQNGYLLLFRGDEWSIGDECPMDAWVRQQSHGETVGAVTV